MQKCSIATAEGCCCWLVTRGQGHVKCRPRRHSQDKLNYILNIRSLRCMVYIGICVCMYVRLSYTSIALWIRVQSAKSSAFPLSNKQFRPFPSTALRLWRRAVEGVRRQMRQPHTRIWLPPCISLAWNRVIYGCKYASSVVYPIEERQLAGVYYY